MSVIRPMLAFAGEPFDSPEWAFEPKWDGVRAIAYVVGGTARLVSRHGTTITTYYGDLSGIGQGSPDCVLDGEIVVLNGAGRPSLVALQRRARPPAFVAFDLLELGGERLLGLRLEERRALLAAHARPATIVVTPHLHEHGIRFFRTLVEAGFEGMMAKRLASPYQPGRRSRDWLKIKP